MYSASSFLKRRHLLSMNFKELKRTLLIWIEFCIVYYYLHSCIQKMSFRLSAFRLLNVICYVMSFTYFPIKKNGLEILKKPCVIWINSQFRFQRVKLFWKDTIWIFWVRFKWRPYSGFALNVFYWCHFKIADRQSSHDRFHLYL